MKALIDTLDDADRGKWPWELLWITRARVTRIQGANEPGHLLLAASALEETGRGRPLVLRCNAVGREWERDGKGWKVVGAMVAGA